MLDAHPLALVAKEDSGMATAMNGLCVQCARRNV
jgi:hypothetical protein